ncbi:MAG TPA: hypothetical protein VN845_05795 [Solirubrobacteraceae bacterium]|nr:hypothetical protein [Solirubrobacteraceae bacterium]
MSIRRRRLMLLLIVGSALVVVGAAQIAGHGAPAVASSNIAPTPQPALGTADASTVLMGAATAGQPGEAWAYRVLPLDVPPPSGSEQVAFAPAGKSSSSARGQLVFERATDADPDWTIAETSLEEQGQVYRGMDPDRMSARITPHGGGLLVGNDSTRASGKQTVVLARDPGGRFRVLPEPPAGTLLGAGEPDEPGETGDKSAEALAEEEGSGVVADAAVESEGHTEAYFGAFGRTRDLGVARWDGKQWTREAIELPTSYGGFTIVAIAGTSPKNLWLLGEAEASSGLGIVLFKRKETKAGEFSWQPASLGSSLFAHSETAANGVSGVEPLTGQAQPLTVTEKGVWIDGNLQASGGGADGYDFTLYYDVSEEKVTGSWCDARGPSEEAICEHPLGARFGREAGYRSFAFEGPGYGTRIVTNPLQSGGEDSTNMGSYLSFEGTTFTWMPGAGADNAPGGAFYTPTDGWLEGPVQITTTQQPSRLVGWPVSARAPFTAVTPPPGSPSGDFGAQALAVGADGVVARYTSGHGWEREFLQTSSGAVSSPTLRAVAWPEPARAFAVGNLGAMWIWRAETGLWEPDPAAPLDGFQGNLDGIAFDPSNPALGYAVGQDGVLLRYGKSWTQEEELPLGFSEANFSSVSFAGAEAMVVAEHDLLVNEGSGWKVEPEVHALLESLPQAPSLNVVAGLPNGGAVLAGRDVVLERDSAGAPWHFSEQPIVGDTAIAAAPLLEGSKVRALLSVVPDFQYPPLLVLPPVEPDTPPPVIPPNPLPGDGYLLRETAGGWQDEERAAYAGDGQDKPLKADPILALDVSTSGAGWALGGWSGEADDAGRGTDASGGSGQTIRENVQTAGVYSYAAEGNPTAPSGETVAPIPMQSAAATFAVGGHAECVEACAALADEGIEPDRNLSAALGQISGLSTEPGGPRMLLYTGGRETQGQGPESPAEANRYAQLMSGGGSLPVYPALSAGDTESGEDSAFGAAFAGFDAPFGEGATPTGVSTADIPPPTGAVRPGARTHYAFDSTGPAGTVRVIVIDNSRGSLAAANPYQNPAEPQGPWLEEMLADARARGIPAIVVGSRELDPNLPPALNVATDAAEEAQIMVAGGASAYLYERPEESRASRIPSGGSVTIPEYGTGTLGYRSAISDSFTVGQPDALFGTTGYLLVGVEVAKRNPATNVAPVTARMIPLVQEVSLDPVDGTLLRRSSPALFEGLGRRPLAGDRWGPISGSSGNPNPPGSDPYAEFPPALCRQSDCSSAIQPEYTFTSSEPEIANFVAQDPNSTNLRKPLQNAEGHPIPDPRSGILCAFNAGTTTVTISAGGLSYSIPVTVQGGSVEQPCGTVPLSPSHFKAQASSAPAAPAAPPPSPAPAPAPIAPPPPPPAPAAAPVVKVVPKPAPKVALPLAILPIAALPAVGPVPAVPPPPAASFARPIPPGGATVRVFEEKREEEAAPEQSQAFARYSPSTRAGVRALTPVGALVPSSAHASVGVSGSGSSRLAMYGLPLGVLILLAGAGATIGGGRRRSRRTALARLSIQTHVSNQGQIPTPSSRRRI